MLSYQIEETSWDFLAASSMRKPLIAYRKIDERRQQQHQKPETTSDNSGSAIAIRYAGIFVLASLFICFSKSQWKPLQLYTSLWMEHSRTPHFTFSLSFLQLPFFYCTTFFSVTPPLPHHTRHTRSLAWRQRSSLLPASFLLFWRILRSPLVIFNRIWWEVWRWHEVSTAGASPRFALTCEHQTSSSSMPSQHTRIGLVVHRKPIYTKRTWFVHHDGR